MSNLAAVGTVIGWNCYWLEPLLDSHKAIKEKKFAEKGGSFHHCIQKNKMLT